MNALAKNLLAGFAVGSIALTGAVFADDQSVHAKHKVIEIKADTDSDVNIVVAGDGVDETITLSFDELQDKDLVADRLAHLDEEMRDTILSALSGVSAITVEGFDPEDAAHDIERKVMVVHKGEGGLAMAHSSGDMDFDFDVQTSDGTKVVRKHVVLGHGSEVLKGHTDAIVRLIERGEFSQDELDKIQAAVDAKR